MNNPRLVPFGFLFAGVIMLVAAFVPLFGGRSFNFSTGILAGVFFVIAIVTWRQGAAGPRPES